MARVIDPAPPVDRPQVATTRAARKLAAVGLGMVNLAFLTGAGIALAWFLYRKPPALLPSFGMWNGMWDVGLIALFGLQHSLMARQTYKQWLRRRVPEALERPIYVLASALALLVLILVWQPLGGNIYQLEGPWRELIWALHILSLLMLGYAAVAVDAWDLLGFRQLMALGQNRPLDKPAFTERGIYSLMRHPLMFATLCVLWITPVLSYDRLLLNIGFTLYILIGIALEERDLLRTFGDQYRRYRRRVGLFWPRWRREAAP